MNATLIALAERRATLVARAATQRVELSQAWAPWRGPWAVVDRGVAAVRYIGSHPALLVGVVAFVAALRPWHMAGWLRRGWLVWRVALAVERSLPGLVSLVSRLPPGLGARKAHQPDPGLLTEERSGGA